jgi:hypothetical protein
MPIKRTGPKTPQVTPRTVGGPRPDAKAPATESVAKPATTGPTDANDTKQSAGALAALRSLALETKTPEREHNRGAEAATLGAKLMSLMRSDASKKAYAVAGIGMSLFGMAKPAAAQVAMVEQNVAQTLQQAAQQIAQETGDPYVQVDANYNALKTVFEQVEAGDLEIKHLILNQPSGYGGMSSYNWQNLKNKYPQAFEQVEKIHFIGPQADADKIGKDATDLFPNVKAVVAFDVSGALDPGPASAWLLQQTSAAVDGMPSGDLSAQDALIAATSIAQSGTELNARVEVQVQGQTHAQLAQPTEVDTWFEARIKDNKEPIGKGELQAVLTGYAKTPEGITDGQYGSLRGKLEKNLTKFDYEAARWATHLIEVRVVGGADAATAALEAGNVHEVRHELAQGLQNTNYVGERSPLFSANVREGVPLDGKAELPIDGPQGTAFLVDGLGEIRNGEVNVQAIHHPKHGDGYQLTFKVGDDAGARIEEWLEGKGDARLVDKTIVNHGRTDDGRVVTAEPGDVEEAQAHDGQSKPTMSLGHAMRYEKDGKYRVDYFAESISKQALRGEVHIQVYGKNADQMKDRARDVLDDLGLKDAVMGTPSDADKEMLKALRLLEQSDPRAHHAIRDKLENGETVTIDDLHKALIAAEVPPAFLDQAYFAEVAPGHMSVVVPGQSEAYARRGVRAVYHTISKPEIFAYIANDGALMSTKDRVAVGTVFRGMSSDTDLRTGGADYVFTRQVTDGMSNPSSFRGGALVLKDDALDRTDWYAYTSDRYGTTLSGDRGEAPDAVREVAQRTYDELKEADDSSVKNKTFDQWFERLIKGHTDSRQNIYLPRPVGRHQVDATSGTGNETMLEGTVPISQIKEFVVKTDEAKQKTLDKLKELGVTEINGMPVEDFIKVRSNLLEELEADPATPGGVDAQDTKPADPRLQYYVRNDKPADDGVRVANLTAPAWVAPLTNVHEA